MADEIDAAKLIVRLFRMIEPIAAVVPDLERLGSVRAVEDEVRARVAVLARKESEAQTRLAAYEATKTNLKDLIVQHRSDDRTATESAAAEAARLVETAKAEAAKLIADAKAECAEITLESARLSTKAEIAANAELAAIRTNIDSDTRRLSDLAAQADEAQTRLDAIKAAAREFAGK